MTLETSVYVVSTWDDESVKNVKARLLGEIKAFCSITTNGSIFPGITNEDSFCLVKAAFGTIENGRVCSPDDAKNAIERWVGNLVDWFHDEASQSENGHKEYSVKISDLDVYGGTAIKSYDDDQSPDHSLYILPIMEDDDF